MTSLHSYRNGGFPPANKLLDKIWHHEDYKRHKKKVIKAFRPTIALLNTHVLCGAGAQASAVKGRLHRPPIMKKLNRPLMCLISFTMTVETSNFIKFLHPSQAALERSLCIFLMFRKLLSLILPSRISAEKLVKVSCCQWALSGSSF